MLLFCASDAGGARQLQPVIERAVKNGLDVRVLCSEVTAPIFERSNIRAEVAQLRNAGAAEEYVHGAEAVILGTTGTIKSEHFLTAAARAKGIRSVAVLDEWYSYALRFQDEKGGLTYLPDVICAQDELSVQLAVKEGLPKDRLTITGSPSLAELAMRAKAFAERPPKRPAIFGQEKSVLWLSQPLRRSYGDRLGYHEDMVREDLSAMLAGSIVRVIEKLHPSEGEKDPPKNADVSWIVDAGKDDVWPLLWHADVIIGMVTMGLLEAAMLGRTPVSYQPNTKDPNLSTAVRLGAAELHASRESLARRLPDLLRDGSPRGAPLEPPCARPDAAERVLRAARA